MIYLDHAATTPVDDRVLQAMLPYLKEKFGNPSSMYRIGQEARAAIDGARESIGEILGCAPREILFTSGGTEANNLALIGIAQQYKKNGRHIISTTIEHDSVLKPLHYLEEKGFEVTYVDVDRDGLVHPAAIRGSVRPDTILVSVAYANNEIGVIQPISEIAHAINEVKKKPYFHTDACQAAPCLSLNVKEFGVDAMTLNGGKIYGPKGVGCLYLREGVKIVPQILGGGQEYRVRSGTENVAGIVGISKALELVQQEREKESARLLPLRDMLIDGILHSISDSRLNGSREKRLPNNVNVSFKGLEGETILMRLDMLDIAASSGSACTSASLEPSHVIRALKIGEEWTHSSTRFSLGHGTTEQEIEFVLAHLPTIVKELRELSPFA